MEQALHAEISVYGCHSDAADGELIQPERRVLARHADFVFVSRLPSRVCRLAPSRLALAALLAWLAAGTVT